MKYHPKKKKNRTLRKFLLFLIIIIVSISLIDGIDLFRNRNKILSGVSAFSVKLEGLNKEEAREILQPIALKIVETPRIFIFENQEIKVFPHQELGAFIDLDQVVDDVYSVARTGNVFRRLKNRIVVGRKGYEVPFQTEFISQKFDNFQNKIRSLIERMPEDAYMEDNKIIESRIGIKLDSEKYKEEIQGSLNSVSEEKYTINLPVITIDPRVTTQDILEELSINQEIGTYSTSLENKEENTIYNIKLASGVINGIVVEPQKIFSFNKYVGPAEKADGYKESTIIANGVFANGYGGGICQVSSTLYNAVLLANLPIVERYNHSVYGEATKYVPLGQDAAIFYGFKDLKFKNNSNHEIVIFSKVLKDVLQVSIFGGNESKTDVEIISKDKKVIDYQIIREKDPKLGVDQNIVSQEGVPGYQIKTYRIVRKDGEEKRELLAEDIYNSVPMIVKEN
ncbi:MAG TPA: hypothetical protein ENO17_03030 [Candidatus Atribacteria bacterium]|nr:hypothetical protein [Candidatus Atribacteria bacterium]